MSKVKLVGYDDVEVSIYCPICQRYITASNVSQVRNGEHDGFIYVHDDMPHDDTDIEAINNGIQ